MTRPMPGPPQWYESAGLGDWDSHGRWRNRWNLYHEDGRAEYDVAERPDKRLTDVGCAAHYWQALADRLEHDADVNCGYETPDDTLDHRAEVWRRFAHTPQALETMP